MADAFLDTNVILRHLLGDVPRQSAQSGAFLARVEKGEVAVRISDTIVFEVVFTLERGYRISKDEIREKVLPLIELPGVELPGKRRFRKVFDLYVDLNISFADAYHAATMQRLRLKQIISFDKEFDRVDGITRVDP